MDWIRLVQDMDQRRVVVNVVMILSVHRKKRRRQALVSHSAGKGKLIQNSAEANNKGNSDVTFLIIGHKAMLFQFIYFGFLLLTQNELPALLSLTASIQLTVPSQN